MPKGNDLILMKKTLTWICALSALIVVFEACDYQPNRSNIIAATRSVIDTGVRYIIVHRDTSHPATTAPDSSLVKPVDSLLAAKTRDTLASTLVENKITGANPTAKALVDYAKTLVGKPYAYGANTPEKGFDNSGFVNFVFANFGVKVPQYAPAFIATGEGVAPAEVTAGDIILFSKTDSLKKAVFQVGIVVSVDGNSLSFIHASSGKMNGVGISNMSSYYQKKLMGYRRMF